MFYKKAALILPIQNLIYKRLIKKTTRTRNFVKKRQAITFSFHRTDITNLLFRINTAIVIFPVGNGYKSVVSARQF